MKLTQTNQTTGSLGKASWDFQTSKRKKNSGHCVVALVDKANVLSSSIFYPHVRR